MYHDILADPSPTVFWLYRISSEDPLILGKQEHQGEQPRRYLLPTLSGELRATTRSPGSNPTPPIGAENAKCQKPYRSNPLNPDPEN